MIAANAQPFKVTDTQYYSVETLSYKDGTKTQSISITPTYRVDTVNMFHAIFPDGTKISKSHFNLWAGGIYWSASSEDDYEPILPTTQPAK